MTIGDDDPTLPAVAQYRPLDPYSLWRALKDLENEIYSIGRANEPIPIEMLRMRAAMLKARGSATGTLGLGSSKLPHALARSTTSIGSGFEQYEFVDRYRSLGGLRTAMAWGDRIRIFAWNEDAYEAAAFWDQRFPALSHDEQQAVAACLLERGRS